VSHFCACIGSPCLRQCVHGASIGFTIQTRVLPVYVLSLLNMEEGLTLGRSSLAVPSGVRCLNDAPCPQFTSHSASLGTWWRIG
jgi:hypothetical protein